MSDYNKSYCKISGSLCQYFREDSSDPITYSESFKLKTKIIGDTSNNGYNKKVKII